MTISGNPAAHKNGKPSAGSTNSGRSFQIAPGLRQIHEVAHEFGVFALDPAGRVVTWNANSEQTCGYSAEEILGRDFSCFYRPTEVGIGEPLRALADAVAKGRFEEQAWCRRHDGSSFWAKVTITAARDGAGNHCGFACMVRDLGAASGAAQELQSRLGQQEAISRLGLSSLERGGLADLMRQAAMISTAGLKADLAAVLELDTDSTDLTIAATSAPERLTYVGTQLPGGRHSLSGYTLYSNEPVICEDLAAETRFRPQPALLAYGAQSGISVAIKSRGVALGVIVAFTRVRRTFSHHDINFMQAIANILASALDRSAAEERLRRSERYLHTVIGSSSDVIAVLDPESNISFMSGAGEAMFGSKVDEMVGRRASDYAHPDDVPIRDRLFATALARPGVAVNAELRVRRADGTYHECEVVMRALADIGGAPGVLVNVRDISARKRNELELARAHDAALESSRLKSAFLANISHEFRTPLNIIVGYNDLIAEHLAEMRDSSQAESVDAVTRACNRLLQMLNAVLDYSKLESRSFQIDRLMIRPVPLIRRLVAEMMPQVAKKGLTAAIEFDEEGVAVAFDEYCLTQALHNLLENAIKFTERGSVTIRVYRDADEALCVHVADTGIGIEKAFQAHLLEPFSQEDNGISRRFEGAGLGLALTRRYLELNGARLTVSSAKGEGSTFTIHFEQSAPAVASATGVSVQSADQSSAPSVRPAHLPMVMMIEDDLDNQILMRAMLKNRYRTLTATSPVEFRRQIELFPGTIDIILVDLGLSGIENGLALTQSLRKLDRFRTTPIVALTAHAMTVGRAQALAAGCDDYIVKPVDRTRLFAAIELLLHPMLRPTLDDYPLPD